MTKGLGLTLLMLAAYAGIPAWANSLTLPAIADRMRAVECYRADADYEVLLPNFSDPVHYTIRLQSQAEADSLAPCRYIIDWQLETPVSHSEGFSAYFDGTHFRFRDRRLQEYHVEEDAAVFAPLADHTKGVQYQVQFAELLPPFLADHFLQMAADSTFHYTVTQAGEVRINGVRRIMGYDSVEFEYVLDPVSYMPLKIELVNNPAQMGEQVVTVNFSNTNLPVDCHIDAETLMLAHSVEFERYRSNSFSLEQLTGAPLPELTGKTIGGERFTRNRGQGTGRPLILAFVDAEVGTTPEVISAVRGATDFLPLSVDVIWAFMNRRPDVVEEVIGVVQPSETVLVNSGAAARQCGVGELTPALIFVDAKGNVTDVNLGFNQNLQSVVIQKAGINAVR